MKWKWGFRVVKETTTAANLKLKWQFAVAKPCFWRQTAVLLNRLIIMKIFTSKFFKHPLFFCIFILHKISAAAKLFCAALYKISPASDKISTMSDKKSTKPKKISATLYKISSKPEKISAAWYKITAVLYFWSTKSYKISPALYFWGAICSSEVQNI